MWIKVVSLRPIKKNTVMTNDRLKGFTYGALAAASYGLNPLFALPLYGAGMKVDSVLFYRYFCHCNAGHTDESEEAILCLEKDGYTSAGGNGTVVLFFFTFLV